MGGWNCLENSINGGIRISGGGWNFLESSINGCQT